MGPSAAGPRCPWSCRSPPVLLRIDSPQPGTVTDSPLVADPRRHVDVRSGLLLAHRLLPVVEPGPQDGVRSVRPFACSGKHCLAARGGNALVDSPNAVRG